MSAVACWARRGSSPDPASVIRVVPRPPRFRGSGEPLVEDGAHHPHSVAYGVQVALAVDALLLHTRYFADRGAVVPGHPDVDQGLDLEPVTPQLAAVLGRREIGVGEIQDGQSAPPEGVVAVAQVGEPGPEQHVDRGVEHQVAHPPQEGDVQAAAAVLEARSLGEGGSVAQRGHKSRDLLRIGRSVGIDHHDDVAGAAFETTGQGVSLTLAGLGHHLEVWPKRAGHVDGAVDRTPVDQDDLVRVLRNVTEDVRQVGRFVQGRHDDADRRLFRTRDVRVER